MTEVAVGKGFLDAASRLAAKDRARVLDFMAHFHANPANPGTSLERVTQARDPHLWSARITRDLRAILHKDGGRALLLYAGHHDDAYAWAERRRISAHPVTGALQIVESAEETEARLAKALAEPSHPPKFPAERFEDAYLASLGVPEDWLPAVRMIRSDDELLDVAAKLPEEVADRLFALAVGELVTPPKPTRPDAPLRENADTQSRFFVVEGENDLADVLHKPLEAWIRFLHPSQRALAEGSFAGPAKVTGSAGTGKTVVALHRARALARRGHHVLLTSFVRHLCRNLERQLGVLCRPEEQARIRVGTVHQQAFELARTAHPKIRTADERELRTLLTRNRERARVEADDAFLWSEWSHVIDAHGLATWEAYRDADRRGRGRPLTVRDRERLWQVFGAVWGDLDAEQCTTWSGLCRLATAQLAAGRLPSPFDSVIVDEVQDLQPAAVQLLAALGGSGRDGLLLVGDAGQRIYPGGFSLRSLGIDVRGRSRVLRINYRTTAQIERAADRLLAAATDDLDEGRESRRGIQSLRSGPEPTLRGFATDTEERRFLIEQIERLAAGGLALDEIGVFARSNRLAEQLRDVLREAGLAAELLRGDDEADTPEPAIRVGTMHGAKGLEFKAVFVAACDAQRLPSRYVLGALDDPAERDAALAQERSLLYVSMTRARDEVFVTWSGDPSPFVAELLAAREAA